MMVNFFSACILLIAPQAVEWRLHTRHNFSNVSIKQAFDMIQTMKDVPENMVGFRASGEITQEDFTVRVAPVMQEIIATEGKINYLLVLDPLIENNALDSWWGDTLLSLRNLSPWDRIGVVSESEDIKHFTYLFGLISHGKFKGFRHDDLYAAIDWVSEKNTRVISI